ncbi:hypothetical protein K491DRAFT_683885 [Lophiostoma macrostomum CBS 122681]|uniref:U4/U6.U5 small nuclear ribonucleoprotein 27kDa protein domain-containing protein n=1 Tax=Lophiostoma macrostomum CBS 122681 TaxID=1314788 RepID=A0A6A6SNX9_9PLEO|nr:hypothetical protein K491DRAFT_683885 [Lophiostoma macrostomum CBS 122681]
MDEEDDIAAAMGFSSFGTTKKRKFDQTNSPKVESSGANTMPLGVRPKRNDGVASDQDHETSGPGEANDAVKETTELQPAKTNSKGKEKQTVPSGLAGFLARGNQLPDKPSLPDKPPLPDKPSANPTESKPVAPGYDGSAQVSFGGPSITKMELDALRGGVQNEHGDVAYFLPSFLEDPWEKLDK